MRTMEYVNSVAVMLVPVHLVQRKMDVSSVCQGFTYIMEDVRCAHRHMRAVYFVMFPHVFNVKEDTTYRTTNAITVVYWDVRFAIVQALVFNVTPTTINMMMMHVGCVHMHCRVVCSVLMIVLVLFVIRDTTTTTIRVSYAKHCFPHVIYVHTHNAIVARLISS